MRLLTLTLTAAVVGIALAGQATAQDILQPPSVQPAGFTPDYYAQDPPQPVELQPAGFTPDYYAQDPPQPLELQPAGFTPDYYAQDPPQPVELQPSPSDLQAAPSAVNQGNANLSFMPQTSYFGSRPWFTVNGWIDGGGTYNAWNSRSNYNGTVAFNDRDDRLQLNQAYVYFQRLTDTSNRTFDIGGRMDMLWGTDGRYTQASGLELEENGTGGLNSGRRFYHFAAPQFYTDLAVNRLIVRIGHFYSIMGYESVMAPYNFFYSHSYMRTYGEPYTFTGGMAFYQLTDNIRLFNGLHQGWNIFNVSNLAPAYANRYSWIGGFQWYGLNNLVGFTSTYTIGNENTPIGYRQRTLSSNVATARLTQNAFWVGQCDIGRQIGGSGVSNGQNAEWYGISQYMFYRVSDTWRLGTRVEWFRDDDGARVFAVGDPVNNNPTTVPLANNNPAHQSMPGAFYEISVGANWFPLTNFVMRPEVRWDWYNPATGVTVKPFNDAGGIGRNNSQFTAAVDGIVTW